MNSSTINIAVFKTTGGSLGVAYAVLAENKNCFIAYTPIDSETSDTKMIQITIDRKNIISWINVSDWDKLNKPLMDTLNYVRRIYSVEDLPCGVKPCKFTGIYTAV